MKTQSSILGKILISTTVFYFISCANPVSPTGGVKDTNPPKIESFKITELENKKHLLIQFDENIVFQNTIELSPYKTKAKPSVIVSRNKILIQLDSNTNSINFNDAIKDLNEGNKATLSNLIVGSDSSIKYYKVQSIPKNKEKILAYGINNQYIYPYNTTINGYAFGEGLPNQTKLKTIIYLDQNKNQQYDSTEWAYIDTIQTVLKPFFRKEDTTNQNNNLTNNTYSDKKNLQNIDTIEAILYPPKQNEIKYYIDSNEKQSLIIVNNSIAKNKIKSKYKPTEEHGDTLLYSTLLAFSEIQNEKLLYKKTRVIINKSSKIVYHQYIYEKDTIYFQEKYLSNFNIKKVKQPSNTSYIDNKDSNFTDSLPVLDMVNPFTNPHGTNYTDIPKIQDEIDQIQSNIGIQFISFSQMQKQLRKEIKDDKSNTDKILKPKELKKLGKLNIQNDSNFNCGLSIYKEGKEIITSNCSTGNKTIVLPVGNYQYFTWKDDNNDQICQQPEEILEYFFETEVLEKIENTIIVKKTKTQEKNVKIPAIIQSE